jgi:hypothetical protein
MENKTMTNGTKPRSSAGEKAAACLAAFMACWLLALTCSGAASAQSWSIKDGRNTGMLLPTESRKLSDGSTYLTGGSRVHVATEDPTYPITGCSMDCRWSCKIAASGSEGACVSQCAGVDKDGDLFSFRALAFGAGKYEVGPGTGKYANAAGGGTFEPVPTDDPGLTYTRWRGTLRLGK